VGLIRLETGIFVLESPSNRGREMLGDSKEYSRYVSYFTLFISDLKCMHAQCMRQACIYLAIYAYRGSTFIGPTYLVWDPSGLQLALAAVIGSDVFLCSSLFYLRLCVGIATCLRWIADLLVDMIH
jgi:hypothetical protein